MPPSASGPSAATSQDTPAEQGETVDAVSGIPAEEAPPPPAPIEPPADVEEDSDHNPDNGGNLADISSSDGEPVVVRSSGGSDKVIQTEAETEPPGQSLEDVVPLDAGTLLQFTGKDILPQCLAMMDESPELVYRCADLMSVAVKVMGNDWTKDTLLNECLLGEVLHTVKEGFP